MDPILSASLNPAVDIPCAAEVVKPTIKVPTIDQVEDPGDCGVNVARVIVTLGGKPKPLYLAGAQQAHCYGKFSESFRSSRTG